MGEELYHSLKSGVSGGKNAGRQKLTRTKPEANRILKGPLHARIHWHLDSDEPTTVELERNVALCDLISEQGIWDEGTTF